MTEPDELTKTLRAVEHRLRPTEAERERARATMRRALQQARPNGTAPLTPADEFEDVETADLGLLRLDDGGDTDGLLRRQNGLLLVAASVIVVVLIAAALVIGQDRSELATDSTPATTGVPGSSTTSVPPPPAIPLEAEQVGTVLPTDRYSTVLDGTMVSFEITTGQELTVLEEDRLRLVAIDPGVGPAPKELTIAILRHPFDGETPADWLQANNVNYGENLATTGGDLVLDYELELSSASCESLSPCLDLAHERSSEPTDAPLTLIDGANRLLVLDLSPDRSLVVLDTSGGNRSGPSQSRYNTVVATLEVREP